MLRSKQVTGLPVVTFDTGEEVGSVKDVIVNRIKKCVVGFLVRRPGWFRHLSVLPFDDIMSIENDTVNVPTEGALIRFNKAPDEVRLLERKPLPGSTLISTGGHELGRIVDFAFNEHSGRLEGFDLIARLDDNPEAGPKFLALCDQIFVGKYDVIVSEEASNELLEGMIEIDDSASTDEYLLPDVSSDDTVTTPVAEIPFRRVDLPAAAVTAVPMPVSAPLTNPIPMPMPTVAPVSVPAKAAVAAVASPAVTIAAGPAISAAAPTAPVADHHPFKITRDGSQLTVSYDEVGIPDELSFARLREHLMRMLADKEACSTLCFDVTNFKFLPSIMLGLLASLRKQVPSLEILNPSRDSREVLRMMGFDKLFTIRERPV